MIRLSRVYFTKEMHRLPQIKKYNNNREGQKPKSVLKYRTDAWTQVKQDAMKNLNNIIITMIMESMMSLSISALSPAAWRHTGPGLV